MNRTDAIRTVDRLIRKTMLGEARYYVPVLLVARALLSHVEEPARKWTIFRVAFESALQADRIAYVRRALLEGTPIVGDSTFEATADTWLCFVAVETAVNQGRAFAIEVLEPYAFWDCGCVMDVSLLRITAYEVDNNVETWARDLEDVPGIARIEAGRRDTQPG